MTRQSNGDNAQPRCVGKGEGFFMSCHFEIRRECDITTHNLHGKVTTRVSSPEANL
jgi:hypothetical protein